MAQTKKPEFSNEVAQQLNSAFQANTSASWRHLPKNFDRNRLLETTFREFLESNGLNIDRMLSEDKKASETALVSARKKYEKKKLVKLPKNQLTVSLKKWPPKSLVNISTSSVVLLLPSAFPGDEEVPLFYETQNLPANLPNDIKTFVRFNGSGFLGIEAQASQPDEHKVIILQYTFKPDQDATWTFMTPIEFHGWYSLWADDAGWNFRRANILLEASISVSQYFPGTANSTTLIDIGGENLDVSSTYDNLLTLQYSLPLRKGDPVTVTITITLDASARGDDSRAELNFNDGTGNFIRPHDTVAMVNP